MCSPRIKVFLLTDAGCLLLLVHNYASSPTKAFIPHTALGILLLIIALLLAYAGWVSVSHLFFVI